jgi:autotransporter-associated beta strand protein
VLNNSSSGKILLAASNTYSGGTTLNNTGVGTIAISNAAAFGTAFVIVNMLGGSKSPWLGVWFP